MKVRLHRGFVGEVDEVYLYTAAAFVEWQRTEIGQWCKERDIATDFTTAYSVQHYGVEFTVYADMDEKDYILYLLKFDKGARDEYRST